MSKELKVLSIDFDYYIDTDIMTRSMDFPDGHDLMNPVLLKFVWDRRIEAEPSIRGIGVINEYHKHMEQLRGVSFKTAYRADSHRAIWESCLKDIPQETHLTLTHIDFHHDFYVTGGDKVDCGNWLRHLMDKHPDTEVLWVKREDSDTNGLFGEFPYPMQNTVDLKGYYDRIFLCFSPEWTPPHLREDYERMCGIFRE